MAIVRSGIDRVPAGRRLLPDIVPIRQFATRARLCCWIAGASVKEDRFYHRIFASANRAGSRINNLPDQGISQIFALWLRVQRHKIQSKFIDSDNAPCKLRELFEDDLSV
jgi:hypothetical protein